MAAKRRSGGSRRSGGDRSGRWGGEAAARRYPRVVRINEVLRQVLADEIERLAIADERLHMLTVTAVEADPDYRRARVLFSVLGEEAAGALGDARPRLQAAVARQVRLKWTPTLSFEADPAVAEGHRVEEILRGLAASSPPASPGPLSGALPGADPAGRPGPPDPAGTPGPPDPADPAGSPGLAGSPGPLPAGESGRLGPSLGALPRADQAGAPGPLPGAGSSEECS